MSVSSPTATTAEASPSPTNASPAPAAAAKSTGGVKRVGACNFIAHLASLARPPSRGDGFAALDGFRGALTVWMVMFHSIAYIGVFYPDRDMTVASHHPSLAGLLIGPLAVDGFFVLTGFLLTYALLDEKPVQVVKENVKAAPPFSIRDWYYRRVSRMVPLYVVVLLLYCQVLARNGQFPVSMMKSEFQLLIGSLVPNPSDTWATGCESSLLNVLFINNLLPGGGCLGHTWSFAIQFQFYLLVPILFRFLGRGRGWLIVCTSMIALSIAFRVIAYQLMITIPNPIDSFFVSFFWYTNTAARANALFMGALMAYLCVRTTFVTWLKQAFIIRKIIMVLGSIVITCLLKWSTWYGDGRMLDTPGVTAVRHANEGIHHWIYWVFFNVGSPVSALAFGYLIVAVVYRVGVFGNFVGKVFSSGFWHPFAQLSFSVYLIHPIVYTVGLPKFYLPSLDAAGIWGWAVLGLVANFIAAAVLFAVVEKPLDIWLRGGEHPRLSWLTFVYCILLAITSILATPTFFSNWMSYTGKPEHNEASKAFLKDFPEAATAFMRAALAQDTNAAATYVA